MDIASRPHVPDSSYAVSATSDKNVESRVKGEGIDAAEVAVVVSNDFVRLEIPALDHFVFTAGEQIRVSGRHGEAADGADMPGQCKPEGARGKIPYLDRSVARATGEPFIPGLDGQGSYPAEMT